PLQKRSFFCYNYTNKTLMDLQLFSQSELLSRVAAMISESPVLQKEKELAQALAQAAKSLDRRRLEELFGLLQAEEADWQTYLEGLKKDQEAFLTRAGNESLQLQKEAEKLIFQTEESISEEEDASKADTLLKQL